jgi:hypothetical protein
MRWMQETLERMFGQRPRVTDMTELCMSDGIAAALEHGDFTGGFIDGRPWVLEWREPSCSSESRALTRTRQRDCSHQHGRPKAWRAGRNGGARRSVAMRRLTSAVVTFAVYVAVGGCGTATPTTPSGAVTRVPITDLRSVAGKWEGVGQGPWAGSIMGGHTADWVEFTIRADGTYEARSYREIGVLRSAGTLTVSDDVVHWRSDLSRGVMYLVADQGGKRVLKLKGDLTSGAGALTADLMPADQR